MKTVKTLLMTFCLALAGCGMTDPWEQYEHQGDFTDRLLPSDTEKALCAADGWKMTYQNTDFYFQFSEDGNVVCNSSLFENESTVTYHLDWDDPMEVKVVIAGGGHLSYLSNNEFGETLIVTSVSDNELKCRPESSETEYTMTAVTESELVSAMDNKWAVKNTLTASDGWKFTYEGSDFYFQFSEDGNVTCNSNMPKAATSTTYSFSGSIEDMILTIVGGGHLSYLSEDVYEDSFKVKSHTASQIELTGVSTGAEIVMTAVTDQDIADLEIEKGAIFKIIEIEMYNGVIRSSDDKFLAHYALDTQTGNSIRFDILANRVLTHETVGITIDQNANVTFETPVTVAGESITGISFDIDAKTGTLNGVSGLKLTSNAGMANWVGSNGDNGFRTYVIIPRDGRGDLPDELMEELNAASQQGWYKWEISDRDRRPWICSPSDGNDNKYYTGFYGSTENSASDIVTDEIDRIKFSNMTGGMPLGGDTKNIAIVQGLFPKFLDAVFHEDGLYVILEGEKNVDNSQLYLISPTTDKWFKADRDM